MTSYERSITTMGLSRIVSEIHGDFSRKSQFSHPRLFAASAQWILFGIAQQLLSSRKLERSDYQTEEEVNDIFSGFDTIHKCDKWTVCQSAAESKDPYYS